MRVLMITGDKRFGPGHPRFELQRSAVDSLEVVYWGRGSAGWRIWPKVPKRQFDVVTAQDPFWRGLFAWRVARRLGAKFNVQVHADLEYLARGYRIRTALRVARPSTTVLIRYPLARFVLRHADSVRVVSQKIQEQIKRTGIHVSVTVLPVYIDIEKFRNMSRQPGTEKIILWVGRFEEEKDPFFALEIFKHVNGARLVMLGGGSLEQKLRAAAQGLSVEFPGWQDPKPYLETASVVLSTSRHESYGASIIEALAAGVPVVAPDVGVSREAGAFVVPRETLAEKVIEVLQSGARGSLKMPVLSKEEWVAKWKESLI